ncbi:hypothetical protein CC78DRAFT_541102 [Lojkania enalia]|uniref:Receptor L-domain domain-containing protein n=1 Tax=Lojkania enalia TaxID=147567 RepID=A0A9P4KFP0_9PLEO|nr:hypothetical protein CC78DRAFT_541102 [Didymosphaeria enalia]
MKLRIGPLIFLVLQCLICCTGAVDCAPASQSFTIKTPQNVSDINTCETFTGNIVVAADGPEEIALEGISTINGNLDIENVANLRSLSSKSLKAVSSFTLNNLPKLSELSFPALKNFTSLKWYNLPVLAGSAITAGLPGGEIQEITIVNTSIKSLDWLIWPVGGQLNISDNAKLEKFSIPYGTINAGSTLTFSNNTSLVNITISSVSGIYGALQISDTAISEILFDELETISGYVQLNGDFKNVSMPILRQINGALNVQSTGDISSLCNNLEQAASSQILRGHYECNANVEKSPVNPTLTATTTGIPVSIIPSATKSPSPIPEPSGGLSEGVKIGISVAIAVVVTVLLVFLALLCFKRRIRAKVQEIEKKPKPSDSSTDLTPPDTIDPAPPKELESPRIRVELASGRQAQELDARERVKEMEAAHGTSELDSPITPISRAGSWWTIASDGPLIRHELPA